MLPPGLVGAAPCLWKGGRRASTDPTNWFALCRDAGDKAAKEANDAQAELAAAAKAAAALLKDVEALMPALTDQAGEMAGACNRAKNMEEGLAAAASQAAQQQRRLEQLERPSSGLTKLAEVGQPMLLFKPRQALMQCGSHNSTDELPHLSSNAGGFPHRRCFCWPQGEQGPCGGRSRWAPVSTERAAAIHGPGIKTGGRGYGLSPLLSLELKQRTIFLLYCFPSTAS